MKTDAQLGRDIEAELVGEPSINATHVGVAVDEVVVTLRGQVRSNPERDAACGAALAAPGGAEVVDEPTAGV